MVMVQSFFFFVIDITVFENLSNLLSPWSKAVIPKCLNCENTHSSNSLLL